MIHNVIVCTNKIDSDRVCLQHWKLIVERVDFPGYLLCGKC